MPASYAYAVGNIRAKEAYMLKKQDISQLIGLDSVDEAAAFLRDKGYAYADSAADTDSLLKGEEQKLWEYIASVAPEFSLFSPFILANDCHNIKAVFKSAVKGRDCTGLLLYPGTVKVEDIKKAAAKDLSGLPGFVRNAAGEAMDCLIKLNDPQLCDALIDAAFSKEKLRIAQDIKIPMLRQLINTGVFYDNFKAAIRSARASKSREFMESCLVDTEGLDAKPLISAALKGVDALLELLEKQTAYKGREAAEAYRTSPSEFERFVDNYQLSLVKKARYVAVGAEPLIAYLQAKLTEIKTVRIAVNGIAAGLEPDKISEMLRELYG